MESKEYIVISIQSRCEEKGIVHVKAFEKQGFFQQLLGVKSKVEEFILVEGKAMNQYAQRAKDTGGSWIVDFNQFTRKEIHGHSVYVDKNANTNWMPPAPQNICETNKAVKCAGRIPQSQSGMKAVLKKIELCANNNSMLKNHPIIMFFADTTNSKELYSCRTTIESQFCNKDEYDWKNGLPDQQVDEKINYASSFIGKTYEINLHMITVEELTNKRYVELEIVTPHETKKIKNYYHATYLNKEDWIHNLKYTITFNGIQGLVFGITSHGISEDITIDLFFPQFITRNPGNAEKELRRKYLNEDVDKIDFKERFFEFKRSLNKKYHGKSVFRAIE